MKPFDLRIVVTLLLLSCGSTVYSQAGPAPSYIDSMADFEVRELAGEYSPSNGTEDLISATPSEWLSDDPGVVGLAGVITAWSGGAKSTSGTRMFVHGGGHNDSANNGLYAYEFSGTSKPRGWELLSISSVSDERVSDSYSDGRPAAVHTYDGMVYAGHNNHVYRFGGAIWSPTGGFTDSGWKYNIEGDRWTQVPDHPGSTNTVGSIYDSVSRKIVVGFGGNRSVAFFRTDTDTWSGLKDTGPSFWGGDVVGAYDSSRQRGVLIGRGESRLVSIDWDDESLSVEELPASGATELLGERGPSAVYDPIRDSYWIFGGTGDSSGWDSIYEMNAEDFAIARVGLSGTTIKRDDSSRGSYGRYVFMPEWRAIGVVAAHDSPAYVIKLPTGSGSRPKRLKSPTEFKVIE